MPLRRDSFISADRYLLYNNNNNNIIIYALTAACTLMLTLHADVTLLSAA